MFNWSSFYKKSIHWGKSFFGEFLINAQGEDVVAGTRTPQYITKKAKQNSGAKTYL